MQKKVILSNENSIVNQFIAELRDQHIQTDSMRFRKNMERLGEIFAYEISKSFTYRPAEVTTPLGQAEVKLLQEQPVLATVLRAGLPFHSGMHNLFDKAQNAFVSAYRKMHKDCSFEVKVEYMTAPDLNGKTVILSDPMIATGTSLELAYQSLLQRGTPSKVHIAAIIASAEGLDYLMKKLPETVQFWVGAVDEELTAQSYIVPGLGDAGDLAFGLKL